jgi:hypothetical protein
MVLLRKGTSHDVAPNMWGPSYRDGTWGGRNNPQLDTSIPDSVMQVPGMDATRHLTRG